jgi:hypothetical protein
MPEGYFMKRITCVITSFHEQKNLDNTWCLIPSSTSEQKTL